MRDIRVLVTDGETRACVAAVRGLADAGFAVISAAPHGRIAPAHWSRAVAERARTTDPLADEAGFVASLEAAVREHRADVLMPGADASLLAISRGRSHLEPHVRIGLPPAHDVWRALDKVELTAAAGRHGLAPPPTVVCRSAEDALSAARGLGLPVVVKPLRSVVEQGASRHRSGSELAAGPAELEAIIAAFGGAGLVQRHVAGALVSFGGVFAGGEMLGEAVSRYRRTWRPGAGNACYSQTVDAPPALGDRVSSLLAELGWEGLFELELIEASAGVWHAIDLNPRPYGSMALAIAAGANLPAIWCRHLLGESVAPIRAVAGARYRWTDADLRHALWQLRAGHGADAARALVPRRHVAHPFGRGSDPGPGAARLAELGEVAARRIVARGEEQARRRIGARADRSARRRAPGGEPAVVIGAGPSGLAAMAHLGAAGVPARCFGEPLEFWSHQMPAGMLLRSRRRSSNIADPRRELGIEDYERSEGRTLRAPTLTREQFIDYGRWFARRAAPDADERKVATVTRDNGGFAVRLQDGEVLSAGRVIVAAGLSPFLDCPEPFASLPPEVRSHAYDHSDLSGFAGRAVAVIGSGQSALECGALLHEHGATVEILARAEGVHWLPDDTVPPAPASARDWRPAIPLPPTDVGGQLTGWAAAMPDVFRRLPTRVQPEVAYRCIRPAGSGWLRGRLADVPITCGVTVTEAAADGGRVTLRGSDGSIRTVDHVLLGTGYRVDVRRYPFLAPSLAGEIAVAAGGYPVLGPGLESTVPGVHFMGAAAALSFGPIMRFVVGTWYSAPAVARRAAGRRQPPVSFAF
ncbi:MAG TPA: FAD-dependent oxidoreductase [Solirubrobacteraceae bacterium]